MNEQTPQTVEMETQTQAHAAPQTQQGITRGRQWRRLHNPFRQQTQGTEAGQEARAQNAQSEARTSTQNHPYESGRSKCDKSDVPVEESQSILKPVKWFCARTASNYSADFAQLALHRGLDVGEKIVFVKEHQGCSGDNDPTYYIYTQMHYPTPATVTAYYRDIVGRVTDINYNSCGRRIFEPAIQEHLG
jgi:hypothetical protein